MIKEFNADNFTFLLNIENNINIPSFVINKSEEYYLYPKNEFHLTIIWRETWEDILSLLSNFNKIEQERISWLIQSLCDKSQFEIILKNDFYFIEKEYPNYKSNDWSGKSEIRKSIIQIVDIIIWLEDFYNSINEILWTKYKVPFPHITLFANSNNDKNLLRWIWIYSNDDFISLKPCKLMNK